METTKTIQDLKQEMFEIIALAKSNAPVSGAAIAAYISTDNRKYNDIEVRAIIEDMRYNDDYYIAGNAKGYYITDSDGWLEYLSQQEGRLMARVRRIRRIRKAYQRYNNELK